MHWLINCFALGTLFFPQESSRGDWKSYDVSDLFTPLQDQSDLCIWGSHIVPEEGAEERKRNPFFQNRDISGPYLRPDDFVSLLRELTGQDISSSEEVFFDVQDKHLLVRAPSNFQKPIEGAIAMIRSGFSKRLVQVRVDLFQTQVGALPNKTVLSDEEANTLRNNLTKEGARTWTADGTVFSGKTFSAESRVLSNFLRGYNVEVATKSKGVQPNLAKVISGPAVTIRPYLLHDNRFHVTCLSEVSNLRRLEEFQTKALDFGMLQRPRIELGVLASNFTIANGESILLKFMLQRMELGFLISISSNTNAAGPAVPSFDSRFLMDRTGKDLLGLGVGLQPSENNYIPETDLSLTPDFISQVFSVQTDRGRSNYRSLNGYYFQIDPKSGVPDGTYTSLESNYLPSIAFQLELLDNEKKPTYQTQLNATLHRSCGAILGEESNYVSGYLVQIAQESTISEPKISGQFQGLTFRCQPQDLRADRVRCLVDLQYQFAASEETMKSGLQSAGNFIQVQEEVTPIRKWAELTLEKPLSLGVFRYLDGQRKMQLGEVVLTASTNRRK